MKVPRRVMMKTHLEFQNTRLKGTSKVGRYLILSTLEHPTLKESKFAFVTSRKVGKAHQRNLVRRRFRSLISQYGEMISTPRYLVMIGRYSTPAADYSELEKEFLRLAKKLKIFPPDLP